MNQPGWAAKNAPWPIRGAYLALCIVLDRIYDRRPIQRFWFLEVWPSWRIGWCLAWWLPLNTYLQQSAVMCAMCVWSCLPGCPGPACMTSAACAGGCAHALLCLHLHAAPVRVPRLVASWCRAAQGAALL